MAEAYYCTTSLGGGGGKIVAKSYTLTGAVWVECLDEYKCGETMYRRLTRLKHVL